jgi:lipopolysaccharide biosynthesis glycosyltransferase
MLNITLLDFYYNFIDIDKTKFNHIHLGMGFDANYVLLSSISIASLLNNSSPDTFIHLHIILNNCAYEDLKPIVALKKINNNIEFILYNGKQAEYDFGGRAKNELRGVGDYARILIPEIVNNTNRIVILDSGDLLVNKDLSELYFFDIEDNYFVFSLDEYAGTSKNDIYIAKNNFYPNTGVCLVNVRKFREDNLYRTSYFTSLAYSNLKCPFQDIIIMISNYKFKFWSLNYNSPQIFKNKEEMDGEKEPEMIGSWFANQKSPYKYSKQELKEAGLNPVISHLYLTKPYRNEANFKIQERWRKYANMTGLIEKIKAKYPAGFPFK